MGYDLGCSHRARGAPIQMGLGALSALVIVGAIPVAGAQQTPSATPFLMFDGVTVVDVDQGKLVAGQRVIIAGNRIQTVGDVGAVQTPKGAQVVDARGKYLIPGLWDLHTHSNRSTDVFYPLFVANGVTGIRDAGSPVPLDTLLQWRREILAGTRVGPPRQVLSGQSIAGPEKGCERRKTNNSPQTCVADAADAVRVVDSLKAAGADMIKPRAVTPALYFVIAAEARRLGIPFGGHAGSGLEIGGFGGSQGPETAIEASDSGARIVDHGYGGVFSQCLAIDDATLAACRSLAEHLRRNDTWVELDRFEGNEFGFADQMQKFWAGSLPSGRWLNRLPSDSALDSMGIAQRADLPIGAGTDVGGVEKDGETLSPNTAVAGFMLHGALARYVLDGLTPLTALRTATLNPAKILHATDSLGTVAAGKLADLVLLDADPLTDIMNTTAIRAVVANGRYYDRAALDQLLTEVRAKVQRGIKTP